MTDSGQEDRNKEAAGEAADEETKEVPSVEVQQESVKRPALTGVSPQDVPDGAQISKAFDTLCNIVRDRMRTYKKSEPIADFYAKGRYVLVTGDGSYPDPCFYTSTPSAGHIFVTIRDGMRPRYDPYAPITPSLPPQPQPPQPIEDPRPPKALPPFNGGGGKDNNKGGKDKHKNGERHPKDPSPHPSPTGPTDPTPAADHPKKSQDDIGPTPKPVPRDASTRSSTITSSSSFTPDAMSYEKLEVVESVEKFSNDE